MKYRWFRAMLALLGIAGAVTAGVLTAIFTAEHAQASAPKTGTLVLLEPKDIPAQTE